MLLHSIKQSSTLVTAILCQDSRVNINKLQSTDQFCDYMKNLNKTVISVESKTHNPIKNVDKLKPVRKYLVGNEITSDRL